MSGESSTSGALTAILSTTLDFSLLDPSVPLQQWFDEKIANMTEAEQLDFARTASNSAVEAGKRINELGNVCYTWINARDITNPIWTNTKVSRDEFLASISYEALQDQSRLWTIDEERKNRALLKVCNSLGDISLEELEGRFGVLWPPKTSQGFLGVLAKVCALLKSVNRIVERVRPIIDERLKARQRPKELYMLHGDLLEI